jgi:WXG100 family type VII secretion target
MATIDNLKVSEESLQNAINNFESRKQALENTYLKISNEVRTLDGTYHGEASEKFKAQFDEMYKYLQQNEQVMENVIENLRKALNIYQSQEESAASAFNAMEEGTAYQSML